MATMKDLARETGLGLATISKYINGGRVLDKNKESIDAAIEKLGFTVNEFARSLKTSRSRTIGVVIPELKNLFVTSIVTAMEDILRRNGYGALICDCRTDEAREAEAVKFLLSKQVDGLVNMPVSQEGAHLDAAIERGLPVALIDRMIPRLEGQVSAVLADNAGAANRAAAKLLDVGYREIGIILGPRNVFTSQQRLLGYSQALAERGLLPDEKRILFSDYSVQGGYESMKRLLEQGCPAVFVTNYEMTLGAIIAANELGVKIPSEVSLIGFDNQQLSQVIRPRLTIVTQPLEAIGEAVADILLTRLEPEVETPPPQVITLATGMVDGESIRKPKRYG